MRTCIIVDDEYLAIKAIKHFLAEIEEIVCVNTFVNAEKALTYLQKNTIDIVFLDIQMPRLNGLELAKQIANKSVVVFTTANPQYAPDAFGVNAIDFLLKPISNERFKIAIDRALHFLLLRDLERETNLTKVQNNDYIIVKSGKNVVKLFIQDILYIESKSEYIVYHTNSNKILSLGALKDVILKLPTQKYLRIHKSYIINTIFIKSYAVNSITLISDETLPIGRIYKNSVKEYLSTWEINAIKNVSPNF